MKERLAQLMEDYIRNPGAFTPEEISNQVAAITNRKVSCSPTVDGMAIQIAVPWLFRSAAVSALNPASIEKLLNEKSCISCSCSKIEKGICVSGTDNVSRKTSRIMVTLV